ncbi:uncharacterized protein IL334_003721 [Kwoniella shivajii]|uniref:SMP domain-containing protein n=1 Tax=Kwoniella shivajii TaxID=564305 RepID=A0ABZ1CYD1_9TREE|nr:hypothetical protein IL334_003721 [Kwoniella shivajii]
MPRTASEKDSWDPSNASQEQQIRSTIATVFGASTTSQSVNDSWKALSAGFPQGAGVTFSAARNFAKASALGGQIQKQSDTTQSTGNQTSANKSDTGTQT